MITKLQSPWVAAVAGLVLSTAVGVIHLWRSGEVLLAHAAVPAEQPAELETSRGWDFWTIEIENLSNELRGERERQRKLADELEQRAARVAAEELQLAKVREELEAIRSDLSAKIVEMTVEETRNLKALAQTYSNLTPRAAVAIFRELDDVMAVKILSLMKPDVVGPIFEEMSRTPGDDGTLATRAAALSNRLRLIKAAKAEATG
jgi:flagellar motility protein MotE (MotC chaperone)